ncbi:MAG: AMP-binding protein [Actinobacteria bacterium]|nr:AMP-binding protein [Actinomycetota bacterium]
MTGDDDLVGAVSVEEWLGAPALSYPNRPRTVVDVLDRAVRRFGPRTFLTAPEAEVSFSDFAELVEGAVERLAEEGVGPGDRLAVVGHNGLDLAVALFACARSGAVLVGLSTRAAPDQWAYLLEHSQATLALGQPEFVPGLGAAAATAGLAADRVRPFGDHLTGRRRPWNYTPAQRPDEAATYAVVYTSGTTGRPKASRVVHRASVHSGLSFLTALGLTGDDVTAVVFALTYISAMHAHLLPMLLVGGRCVLVADASPPELVDIVVRQRVSWLYVVPALWQRLLRVQGFCSPALDHLRLGGFGGSPMPLPAIAELRRRLPHLSLRDVYGLSETHSPATILLDHEFADRPGSVGRPLPCMEARVVDDAGADLPPGEAGELLLRGSLVTTGYDRDPEATAAAIRDGWFRTGDVARIDADGYVSILDRHKDMINRGGHKVFSAEVERVLRDHPHVDDVAVVGVPDPVAGEAVAAFVVPTTAGGTAGPGAGELRRWVRDRLADYAAPRWVHLVDGLPRNATGKVVKTDLRRRAAELASR